MNRILPNRFPGQIQRNKYSLITVFIFTLYLLKHRTTKNNKLFKEKIKTSIILIEREKERKENEWKSDDEPTLGIELLMKNREKGK